MIPCFAETISKWFEFRKAFDRRFTIGNLYPKKTKSTVNTKCSLYFNLEVIRGALINTLKRGGGFACIPYLYASGVLFDTDHIVKKLNQIPTFYEPLSIEFKKPRSLFKRVIHFKFYDTYDLKDENKYLISPKCISEQETFQCRLSYLSVKWAFSTFGPNQKDIPQHCMERMLLQAYKIQDHCDFEFICKDNKVVKASKLILQAGNTFFRGVEDQMFLPNVDAEVVRGAVDFLYNGTNPFANKQKDLDPIQLLELSDEWLLRPLFEFAEQEIVKRSTQEQGEDLILLGTTYNSLYLVEVGKFYLRKTYA